jgi:glutaredoxin
MSGRAGWLLLCVLLAGTGAAHAEKVYKWVDEYGKLHYTNQPPERSDNAREVELRDAPLGDVAITPKPGVVTLYTTRSCGYCKRTREYLRRRGIPFIDHDVETSAAGRDGYWRLNGRGVPIILVGNQRLDGFDEQRLAQMLKSAGY